MPTLPNFLIIGAPKSGTTALWHFLRQHPDIYMSPHKEPRFFALRDREIDFRGPGDKRRWRFVTELSDYERLFSRVDGERAIGEASQWYLYTKSAAPAIRALIPDAKLVAILRDPVERAFSNFLHAVNEGLEPARTFREAMDAEDGRIRAKWSPRFHYKAKGFYFQQIQHYLSFFGPDQLKIYLYEDLVDRPRWLLADLFGYLQVDPTFEIDVNERVNDSRRPRSDMLNRVLGRPSLVRRSVGAIIPGPWKKRLRQRVAELNRKPKPRMTEGDRKHFVSIYREDILHLQSLIGRDLTHWLHA